MLSSLLLPANNIAGGVKKKQKKQNQTLYNKSSCNDVNGFWNESDNEGRARKKNPLRTAVRAYYFNYKGEGLPIFRRTIWHSNVWLMKHTHNILCVCVKNILLYSAYAGLWCAKVSYKNKSWNSLFLKGSNEKGLNKNNKNSIIINVLIKITLHYEI